MTLFLAFEQSVGLDCKYFSVSIYGEQFEEFMSH